MSEQYQPKPSLRSRTGGEEGHFVSPDKPLPDLRLPARTKSWVIWIIIASTGGAAVLFALFLAAVFFLLRTASSPNGPFLPFNTPFNAESYNQRGLEHYKSGEYDKALDDFNRAVSMNPRLAAAFSNRGLVYHAKGDYEKAISDCTHAIAIDRSLALAYNNHGRAMAGMPAVFVEFEREILRDRVRSGIAQARQRGKPHVGRPELE